MALMKALAGRAAVVVVLVLVVAIAVTSRKTTTASATLPSTPQINPKTLTQDELFTPTKIWTAHLTFTQEQWKAIQPARGVPPAMERANQGVRSTATQAANGQVRADDWLIGRDGRRNGWAAAQGIEFEYVHGDLEFEGARFGDVAVRFKGNGTFNARAMTAEKLSFKIDLNKYVKGQKLADVSTLNFHNGISDPSYMNEPMAFRIFRDAGVLAPRTAYVRVYVTITGRSERRYAGLYWLVENVDTNFIQARFKTKDGAILKPVTVNPFTVLGAEWSKYAQTYDPKTDLTPAEEQRTIELCQLVSTATAAQFNARIGDYIDLDGFARYLAVVAWFNNHDSILDRGQNYYMYLPPATKKFLFAAWDQDNSFGNFRQQGTLASLTRGDIYAPSPIKVHFIERMMAAPAFRERYLTRMKEFTESVFRADRLRPIVGELAAAIRPEILKEPPKPQGPRLPAGTDSVAMFDQLAAGKVFGSVISFADERTRFVVDQLSRPPAR